MRLQHWLMGASLALALVLPAAPADSNRITGSPASEITWKKTVIDTRFLSEGVAIADVNTEGQMAWFAPGKDPTQLWEMHPISEPSSPGKPVPGTFRFSHGLGAGDINGDGRLDVITTGGWWEQPAKDDGKPWKFHPANLGPD